MSPVEHLSDMVIWLATAASEGKADIVIIQLATGRPWRIVLKKSFLAVDRKFSGPLVRLMRYDVRAHIVSSKIDHGAP
jgi:hypothetical protein